MKRISVLAALLLALALTLSPILSSKSVRAQQGGGSTTTTPAPVVFFGALTNFDVLNDTGQEAYGFEIELDGVDGIGGTFDSNRYGAPAIVPFPGGVYVRYMSSYDQASQQFTIGTPIATDFTPTTGHQCISSIPSYQTSGCDHFGVWMTYTSPQPSNTIYRWLIADPQNPGQLMPFGTNVSIPSPTWTAAAQQVGAAPVVQAQIQPPRPPRPELQFGDAQWVKVFKTEQPREVGLDELVTDNPVVPENEAEVESEYTLLQTNPHKPNGGALVLHGGLGSNSHSVVRRYEFYKYTGAYDPLTHEALCLDGTCTAPGDGELGDYIGAQMAAVNLGVPSITIQKSGAGTVSGTAVGSNVRLNCGNTCSANVALGTVVTLTANPGNNIFAGWSGACNGTQLTCTVTVNDALTTTATFLTPFTLSVSRGSGTVTSDDLTINCGKACSAKFAQGSVVNLTATAPTGQHLVNWTGGCSGTAPTCSVPINQNTSVQANFAKN